ncbi:MAG: hypothetical protein U5R31_16595 [Acidimicrobiia bacterium]|nr:hypothetical protein [Acidimicrobiia bacterium]
MLGPLARDPPSRRHVLCRRLDQSPGAFAAPALGPAGRGGARTGTRPPRPRRGSAAMTTDVATDAAWAAPPRTDAALVAELHRTVGEALTQAHATHDAGGLGRLSPDDERALARKLLADELRRMAADALREGREPLDEATETALAASVLDRLHGLARLQPLLDDPNVRDIHISGCERVWLSLRDGTQGPRPDRRRLRLRAGRADRHRGPPGRPKRAPLGPLPSRAQPAAPPTATGSTPSWRSRAGRSVTDPPPRLRRSAAVAQLGRPRCDGCQDRPTSSKPRSGPSRT